MTCYRFLLPTRKHLTSSSYITGCDTACNQWSQVSELNTQLIFLTILTTKYMPLTVFSYMFWTIILSSNKLRFIQGLIHPCHRKSKDKCTRMMWHKRAMKTNDKLDGHAYRHFVRVAEKEHVRSEILKSNGNINSIWKILNVTFQERMLYQPLSKIHFSWQTNSMNFTQM